MALPLEGVLSSCSPGVSKSSHCCYQAMTNKELSALSARLQRYLPDCEAKVGLLYLTPVRHTLRGVLLNRSGDHRAFYVTVFLQPLFVPADHIVLNLGWRLGGGSHTWNADADGVLDDLAARLRGEAWPFLSPIESVDDVVVAIRKLNKPADGYAQQALAYSLARAGCTQEAINELERFVGGLNPEIKWQREAADRAIRLISLLTADDAEAQRQLRAWEEQTARSLGLKYNSCVTWTVT